MSSMLSLILRLSLTGGVTCLVCLAASALLRNRMPKSWFYRLWLVVTVSFLVPVPMGFRLPVPQISLPTAYASPMSATVDDTAVIGNSNTALSAQNSAALQQPDDKQNQMPDKGSSGININVDLIIAVTWITGASGMFLWYITGYCLTAGRLKKGRVLLSSGSIPVYESTTITTPLLAGLFRPVIYLPKDFNNTELAVRHELCHWHRGDIWSKWFVQLVVCIHWFNPMAYLMKRELNRLSELACDEAVIRDMDEAGRQAYGQMLLDTLRASSNLGGPMLAVVGSKKQWLRERLLGIMDKRLVTKKSAAVIAALVVIIVGTAALSGGFLSGCSGAGKADQVGAGQAAAESPSAVTAASAVQGMLSTVSVDKSEKVFSAGSSRFTDLNDPELSKLLGYKVVIPQKIAGFELLGKYMNVYTLQKFDLATADSISDNEDMDVALFDESAFNKLSEYDPARMLCVTYIVGNLKTIEIDIIKTTDYDRDNNYDSYRNVSATTIDSTYNWRAGKIDWSANGATYLLGADPNQVTQQEAIEFAKAFMEAQGD